MDIEQFFRGALSISDLINEAEALSERLNFGEHQASLPVSLDMKERWVAGTYGIEDLIEMPSTSLGKKLGLYLLSMNRDQSAHHSIPAPARFPIKYPVTLKDYVKDRIRQTHDIVHLLTNFNTSQQGEMGLQAFYLAQRTTLLSPLLIMKAFGDFWLGRLGHDYLSAIAEGLMIGVQASPNIAFHRLEHKLSVDIDELRSQLNIVPRFGNSWNAA